MASDPDLSSPTIIQWAVGLLVQTLAIAIGGIWRISRMISEERKEIDAKMAGVESNGRQSLESAQRLYQATVEAVKEELHEHVVYVERNFARRDSFHKAVEEIKKEMHEGITRLEQKIDDRRGSA